MKIPKISRKAKLIIGFLWAWGIWISFGSDEEEPISWGRIITGFFFACILTIGNMVIIQSDSVAYARLSSEEAVRGQISQMGYSFKTLENGTEVFIKKIAWLNPKIKLKKTPHHIQINTANRLLSQFEKYV